MQNLHQPSYSGIQQLFNVEFGLENYSNDIVDKMYKLFNLNITANDKIDLVDFGAGVGQLAEIWKNSYGIKPICVEIDPDLRLILRSKGFKAFKKVSSITTLQYVYSSNVLEHIEDDLCVLKEIRNKMKLGGKICIYVPALQILFSELDSSVGHYRRYGRHELITKVTIAGFEVEKCLWNDSLGVLASIFLKILGYNNRIGLNNKNLLLFYDRFCYPISRFLDRILFKHIVGKNLILLAKAA
jgi:SAM-dependent methyltransferase